MESAIIAMRTSEMKNFLIVIIMFYFTSIKLVNKVFKIKALIVIFNLVG